MKAISPVIATVIIVSVAIAISIAVALWLTGITSGFTGLEKLEIVSAYAEKTGSTGYPFVINVTVKNTGTGAATIQQIFINGRPYDAVNAWINTTSTNETSAVIGQTIEPGKSLTFAIYLPDDFTSGQTVEIKIHTAAGKDYPKAVTLP